MANSRQKEGAKIDFDKKFEERQKALTGGAKIDTTGMTSAQIAEAQNQQDQDALADQLLGGGEDEKATGSLSRTLNNEKDYNKFGKDVAEVLFSGKAPYHIDKFYKSLSTELSKEVSSKEIRVISDFFSIMLKQKQTEERKADKNVKNKKVALKGGASKGYDAKGPNQAMLNDVMGGADEIDGEDEDKPFKREEEGEFDFM